MLHLLLVAFVVFLILGILGLVTWHLGSFVAIFFVIAAIFLVVHLFHWRRRH